MFDKIQKIVGVLLGLRKFIVMLCLIAIGVVFRVRGYISGDNFVDMLKATTVSFFASNSIEHMKQAITSYINSKGQTVSEKVEEVGDNSDAK